MRYSYIEKLALALVSAARKQNHSYDFLFAEGCVVQFGHNGMNDEMGSGVG